LKRTQYGQKYYDTFSQKKEVDNHNPIESDKRLTLRKGDEGEEVEKLQETLKKLGFDCQSIDGKFGSNTENAVRSF
jgi:peptidoglycan hydrolase-like protein with peptidoglycan-binding domain